jgi:hypothetical protein
MITTFFNWLLGDDYRKNMHERGMRFVEQEARKPLPEKKAIEAIRPFVLKLIEAMKSGAWEVKWVQLKGYIAFSECGSISFECFPKGEQKYEDPHLTLLWHPKDESHHPWLYGPKTFEKDPYLCEKRRHDLNAEEKKAIVDYLVSTLPEEYQKQPEKVLEKERIEALEKCL